MTAAYAAPCAWSPAPPASRVHAAVTKTRVRAAAARWRCCAPSAPPPSDVPSPSPSPAPEPEAVYAAPEVGEMGYLNMYDGELDAIDRSNRTFGGFNKLTERDTLLGASVSVDGLGREGPLKIFYRESLPAAGGGDGTVAVLLLSGLPASSYSWRDVLPAVAAEANVRAIAPDWLGLGFSDKPAPGYAWSYSTDAYVESLGAFLAAVGVARLRCVVVQGWLATNGLLYALRNSAVVDSVYVLNSPLPGGRDGRGPRMPFALAKWGLPGVVGDAFAQDSLSVEQAIEGGSRYRLAIRDCEVYRRPQMLSGDAGFSLAAATRGLAMRATFAELARLAAWTKPIAIAWGVDDKYLPLSVAEAFVAGVCPRAQITELEGAGHFAQEDFADRVALNLNRFLRSLPAGAGE